MNNRRRLQKEYERIQQSDLKGITMRPSELSLFEWNCIIDGPEDTPYQSKSFEIKLRIPDNYPFSPPKARFITRIFHPNIHFDTGEVCLDLLKSKWSPVWNLESVCLAIQLLLSSPNATSPLNCDAANVLRSGDMMAYNSLASSNNIIFLMNYSKRISKEVEKLLKDPDDEVGIYRVFEGKSSFYAFIRGPDASPFEKGYFKLFMHIPSDYPFQPPVVKFMTPVYHPNISSRTGAICLDILKDRWTAAMNLDTCLRSIQSLLTDAVPDDPQVAMKDYVVSVLYCNDYEKYKKVAKEWTEKYAMKDYISENEKTIDEFVPLYGEKLVTDTVAKNIWDHSKLEEALKNSK